MERDYDFSSCVYGDDLEDPAEIGRRAGERAVKRLGARKVSTTKVPIVFDPRVSAGLVGHLAGAINGASIARGTSFLKDKMGEQIFAPEINIIDDPHRPRGLRSKPFDGEGIANKKTKVIEAGRLTTWILDLASAHQLGLETTGHAARGTSAPPAPSTTNLYMEPGTQSPKELMGRHRRWAIRHGDDGDGDQRHHRRLQPGRGEDTGSKKARSPTRSASSPSPAISRKCSPGSRRPTISSSATAPMPRRSESKA